MTLRGGNRIAHADGDAPATPAGGAFPQGKGWGRGIVLMSLLLAGAAVAQGTMPVPSGQTVTLTEVLIDDAPGETWLRFRFLAPEIARDGGRIDAVTAGTDMDHLCAHLALPYMEAQNLTAARIVVSLMDREVPFGLADPDATQFFEAYRPDGARCIWEEF